MSAYRRMLCTTACALLAACGTPTATGPDISGRYVLRTVNGAPDRAGEVLVVTRDGHWSGASSPGGTWLQSDSVVEFLAVAVGEDGFYGRRTATGFSLHDAGGAQYVFASVK